MFFFQLHNSACDKLLSSNVETLCAKPVLPFPLFLVMVYRYQSSTYPLVAVLSCVFSMLQVSVRPVLVPGVLCQRSRVC